MLQQNIELMGEEVIKKRESIVLRRIHGTYFLIDISDNYSNNKCSLYEINETGEFLWNEMDKKRTIKELAVSLKEAIIDEVDFKIIYDDVLDYINTLYENKFVEVQ